MQSTIPLREAPVTLDQLGEVLQGLEPRMRAVALRFTRDREAARDVVQVIDVESLEVVHALQPGKAVLHLEFTPRGEQLWLSVRDEDRVEVYDTRTFERLAQIPAEKPSGIQSSLRHSCKRSARCCEPSAALQSMHVAPSRGRSAPWDARVGEPT